MDRVDDMLRYAIWKDRLGYPGEQQPDTTEPVDGWWRMKAAKTKPDYPVVVWQDDSGNVWCQIGRAVPFLENSDKWHNWKAVGWYHCEAVEQEVYDKALATGAWKDGKPATRQATEEPDGEPEGERRNAPATETLATITDEMEAIFDAAAGLMVTDQASANKAAGYVTRLRDLWKKADGLRVVEKEPHLNAGRMVDGKWRGPLDQIATFGALLDGNMRKWMKAEKARLDKEQADAAEEARRIAQAAQEASGGDEVPADHEPPRRTQPAPTVQARSEYGRAASLRKVRVAVIVDYNAFIRAIKEHADFKEFIQKKADAAARANTPIKGMEIKEDYQ